MALPEASHVPGVMVSSTFYDLSQVRDDLRRFLQDELGYRPILAEHRSFPINPDIDAVENCRERVERDADVLVLVIGGRYGSIDQTSAKSVTNLEYLAARQKGIPVYAFVDHGILALLPIWKSNPTGDFSTKVDDVQLFEFIELVREKDKVWTQEFKYAGDIIGALRIQFAYQHREGLLLNRRLCETRHPDWLEELRGDTLRVALEKPAAWEYRLFAHALIDATNRHSRLLRSHETGIPFGLGEDVDDSLNWMRRRFGDAKRMARGVTAILEGPLQDALGPPGTPGDAEKLVFLADTIASAYADALRWSARIRAANLDKRLHRARMIASKMMDDFVHQVGAFGPYLLKTVEEAIALPLTGEPRLLKVTLTITVPQDAVSEFSAEMARLQHEWPLNDEVDDGEADE